MARATKFVYSFGKGKAEGRGDQKVLLGGKGAGLAEMTNIGLPVPGGFTITTEACEAYYRQNKKWPAGLEGQVREAIRKLERTCRKKLGDPKNPLLISVRSGAAMSMPGMMETILNLGMNDESVEGLARVSGNRRFALDAYRRFIMMYGATARGVPREQFDHEFDHLKNHFTRPRIGKPDGQKVLDTEVNEEELFRLITTFKELYQRHTGESFPQHPFDQLVGSINAVFNSWMADKAVTYRRVEKITGLNGTAVNVQQMVFGNMGDDSGTGVCFTRDPSTGENIYYGDLLINAQGEDVVAGVRTPIKLGELHHLMPDAYAQLEAVRIMLELHYKEMQDLEFTIEQGRLYMLQCRTGKRSPRAAFAIAVDQASKPLANRTEINRLVKKRFLPRKYAKEASKPVITRDEAILRLKGVDIERLFYPVIDPAFPRAELNQRKIANGINAVPGAACGQVYFSAERAEDAAARGERVILVRKETSPEDVGGMAVAKGILTATGGKTSHAAVVARGWGKCCIVGCEVLDINYEHRYLRVGERYVNEGHFLTLDGTDGEVFVGEVPLVQPEMPEEYKVFMSWCDDRRRLKVRTNADTPADARKAVEMGAEGIGLCRTEHMFFETEQRRLAMQEMIVADNVEARKRALDKLLPFQREDFVGIFEAMNGKPVTIRLIDPPLHEFLPRTTEDMERLCQYAGVSMDHVRHRSEQLHEANPMLGHRGCRLCVTYPEILDMQVRAIIEAAVQCQRQGVKVQPEIMIPLTIDPKELRLLTERTRQVADQILQDAGERLAYMVGTMIETPRAALLGDQIAGVAEFFSFGTNDLTQTTMALSRDDAGRFLPEYVDQSKSAVFAADPFQSLDTAGVGMLIDWAIQRGREARKVLKVGICGEHGGDPASVEFCHTVGMDYVSCSPYRVPIARLAAAKAAINDTPAKPTRKASRSKSKKKAPAKKGKKSARKRK
ncbi:MAG: Pyruvate, phosphate dikinase [Phycisphaerae bacterium]|nr:Pyruvate, phosphate dikinase [Phycisphaerae bacterium]